MKRRETPPTRTDAGSGARSWPWAVVGLPWFATALLLPAAHPRAAGFILYEMGTTDLGTASAGRA